MIPRGPWHTLREHRRALILGALCLALTNAGAQSIPWLVKLAIEAVSAARAGASGATVNALVLLLAAVALGQALTRILSRMLIFNVGRDVEYGLRRTLFAHLSQQDSRFFRRYRTGDLMSRLTNDLSAVRGLLGAGILHGINTVLAYAVALPLMLRIDIQLALLALLAHPLLFVVAQRFARQIYVRGHALQAALASMTASAHEDIAGLRDVRGYRLEQVRGAAFASASQAYLDQSMRMTLWRGALQPAIGLGVGLAIVAVLWLGARKVIAGKLSLGDLVALNLYSGLLAGPSLALGWVLWLWQRGRAAWSRIVELLAIQPALPIEVSTTEPRVTLAPGTSGSLVEVRELTLSGDGGPAAAPLLERVTLSVPPGKIVGVVGPVGAGKTVLAEALARLTPVPPGTVFVNGHDVCTLAVRAVRELVAYAPQDPFLFSASIAENIGYGRATPLEDARVREIAVAAGLEPDLAGWPEGLQTLVGERGLTLSGGQRQRVALARALASERPLLILDDALSAVDAETERRILGALQSMLSGCATILISHRLSAIQHADQVVVLDHGKVVQRGRPAELLAQEGLYRRLYHEQLRDAALGIDGAARE